MALRRVGFAVLLVCLCAGSAVWLSAQDESNSSPNFHVVVDMVQLNVAVTDNKGNYVTGLKPSDFVIAEDGIRQKIATFGEGNQAPKALGDIAQGESDPKAVEPDG